MNDNVLIAALLLVLLFGLFLVLLVGVKPSNPLETDIRKHKKITNQVPIFKKLNFRKKGEPLVAYSVNLIHKRQSKKDPFRLNVPVYTLPTSERGLVVGVSGSGKTTYILAQISDWMKSGKSFIVTDVKPEIWGVVSTNGLHKRFGYTPVVINPTDPKSCKYNVFDDCDVKDYPSLIKIIIPSKSKDDVAFVNYSRRIMYAVALFLFERDGSVSLTSIYRYVSSPKSFKKMVEEIKRSGNKQEEVIGLASKTAESENFVAVGMNPLIDSVQFLSDDIIAENVASSDFSLKEVTKKNKQAIYLQYEQNENAKNGSLYALTVMQLIRILKENSRERNDVFLMFDELSNASKIEGLGEEFNLIRSYKMPAFVYVQTISSLYRLFQNEKYTEHFLNSTNFKLFYRTNDYRSAVDVSNICGQTKADVISKQQTPKVGADGKTRMIVSSTSTPKQVNVVDPEDVLNLPQGRGIAWFGGACSIIDVPQYYHNPQFNKREQYIRPSDIK